MIEIPLERNDEEQARELLHPHFQLYESDGGYRCEATLPGVLDEDLHISVDDRVLKVSGRWRLEHKEETEASYAYDSAGGGFTRQFTLPEPVDAGRARAQLSGGQLTIEVPRKDPRGAREISVSTR